MHNGYWESVPAEYREKWADIFLNNTEGANLSEDCPVCHKKGLHRYFNGYREIEISPGEYEKRGGGWEWCSFCRSFEHFSGVVPNWWVSDLEIDENTLTAVPNILDMAYQNISKVNKWSRIPEQHVEAWDGIFNQHQAEAVINENCPICNHNLLFQYYKVSQQGPVKYKKKLYKGQGEHWKWCPACFHYEHKHLAYVPLEWDCILDIEPWKFMAIPEPIHEIMIMNDYTKSEEGKE